VTTPVLVLTARDRVDAKIAGLDLGADDYLVKPFVLAEVVARLRALIRRAHRVATPQITIADLEVDTTARTVRRAGKVIDLRAKEYALLELLALNHGRVVTQERIRDHIYEGSDETSSNVVDVHVYRLRNRIDRGFAAPLIHTVRGQGYVLRSP
jgi:DNA-binding response OmpR family regulator